MSPPRGWLAKTATAAASSVSLRMGVATGVTPSDLPVSSRVRRKEEPPDGATSGLNSTAARSVFGASSFSSCIHFPAIPISRSVKTLPYRVGDEDEHDRVLGCLPHGRQCARPLHQGHLRVRARQFRRQRRQPARIAAWPAVLDVRVAGIAPPQFDEALPESHNIGVIRRACGEQPDPASLLRGRGSYRTPAECRRYSKGPDKIAPPHSMTSSACANRTGGTTSGFCCAPAASGAAIAQARPSSKSGRRITTRSSHRRPAGSTR